MKHLIDILLTKIGYKIIPIKRYREIKKFYRDFERRIILFNNQNIDYVLDVGANNGGYGSYLRKLGFKGDILSFEPLSSAFNDLALLIQRDPKWKAIQIALGVENETSVINISNNSHSSSLLPMNDNHVEGDPTSTYISTEKVQTKKLDDIFDDYCSNKKVLLKIDTQGFEKYVLLGAKNSLKKIHMIQIEMSLVTLYDGSWLFDDVKQLLEQEGFQLVSIENGFYNPDSGILYQVDGIFIKK
jgi:FkbM family methyltransferase